MCIPASSQEEKQRDSVTLRDFIPSGIRVGADVYALIRSQYDDRFNGWELNAEMDVHRYFVAFEMGNWQLDLNTVDADDTGPAVYANKGTYFRIGADMNFIPRDTHGNVLFLGARYGRSIFSETLTTTVIDPVWGQRDVQFHTDDANARWIELTGGLRVRLWKVLWLGYTARFKFGLSTHGTGNMEPHDVPGYGSNEERTTWGFNYLVLVRFPLRK